MRIVWCNCDFYVRWYETKMHFTFEDAFQAWFDGVALIHAEVQIKEHRSVQVAVARYCEKLGDRGVVIVHNSGQEVTHGHREECLEWLNVLPNATDKGMSVVATTDHPRLKARHQHWRGRAVHLANANPASPLYGPQLQIPTTTARHP